MNEHTVRYLAFIIAEQARMEGMKAENAMREFQGVSPAYGEDAFNTVASNLENLAREIQS